MDNPSSLLPANSTSQERALEGAVSRGTSLELAIAQQWRPDTCPTSLLPWLAWSLSLDDWDEAWSEQTKRNMIKQAAAVHKVKGTVGSVKRALAALGVSLEFIEWFEQDVDLTLAPIHSTTPHTFVFIAWVNAQAYSSNAVVLDQALYDAIYRVTNKVKPARSHFDFLVGAKINGAIRLASASSGWLQSRRLSNETKPVQVPASTGTLAAHMHLNKKRYAVGRFYLR
ncbi:phage tail protein I [Thalassomonas viridans]|uniref:Phage tail protein I n=1 Tax=Thalassomonas viridans TaxID=137584 RepID=A0AAE9Z3Q3_9GAMM|nr:phage tail protein I [Thalassomonas viridans]WDE04688.1 phage tail protein I [Thalassomonas viridans]